MNFNIKIIKLVQFSLNVAAKKATLSSIVWSNLLLQIIYLIVTLIQNMRDQVSLSSPLLLHTRKIKL